MSLKNNRYRTVDVQNNNSLSEQEHFNSNLKRLHSFDRNKKGEFESKIKSSIFIELPLQSLSLPREDTVLPNIKEKKKYKHPPYQRKVERKRRMRENGCVGTRMEIEELEQKNNQVPKN